MLVGSVLSLSLFLPPSFLFRFSFYFHLFLILSTDTSIAPANDVFLYGKNVLGPGQRRVILAVTRKVRI